MFHSPKYYVGLVPTDIFDGHRAAGRIGPQPSREAPRVFRAHLNCKIAYHQDCWTDIGPLKMPLIPWPLMRSRRQLEIRSGRSFEGNAVAVVKKMTLQMCLLHMQA